VDQRTNPDTASLSEDEFEKAIRGDVAVFERIVVIHERLVYNIALRMTGDAEDAADITQECFVKLYKNIRSFNDVTHIKNWLCRVVHNICVDELRKRGNRPQESLDKMLETADGGMTRQHESGEPTPEETLTRRETMADLERALDKLPPDFKMMVVMRDIHGLSYQEISDAAQLELGTVKSRISRARSKLQQLFLREQSDLKIVSTDKSSTDKNDKNAGE